MAMIICPICDEELGNSVDEVPDKCPICDTRKHEIIQELRDREEENENGERPTLFIVEDKPMPVVSPTDQQPRVFVDPQENTETPEFSADNSREEDEHIVVTESYRDEVPDSDVDVIIDDDILDDVVFDEDSDEDDDDSGVIFESEGAIEAIPPQTAAPQSAEKSAPQISITPQPSPKAAPQAAPEPERKKRPDTSGASSLEVMPFGYKYCPACQASYPRNHPKDNCDCSAALQTVEKGFPPGHYLVLYNDQPKAIAYFKLETEGTVFIGRSSERGSAKDIDLSIAWKHYYRNQQLSPEEFKKKMGLLKGISRKHALIRYLKEEKQFVLFHLSDKNHTVIQMPSGETRARAPKNRNKTLLQPNAVISFGNQREYILLRYKVLEPKSLS